MAGAGYARDVEGFRKVGVTTCTALALANMIGTGVFTSLGFQVASLPSPFLILLVWLLGGVVALCGAFSYAELAAAWPRSGGEYNFLTQIYHPALGFMAGVVSMTVGFAAPVALSAMAFGKYVAAAWPEVPALAASAAVVVVLTVMHSITVKTSGNIQVVVTVLKVALIISFIGIGCWKGGVESVSFAPTAEDGRLVLSGSFAVALMFVLYSYAGWNAAAYITDEVRRPEKSVPWALALATVLVTVLYVALNAVFLMSGPMKEFVGKIEVGEIAARNFLGPEGGRVMSGLISLGLISAISAMTWTGPRVAQSIGKDFASLKFLARTSRGGVPYVAMWAQLALVLAMIFTATFEAILLYAQFALLASSFLTVLGLMVARRTQPELARPFRCPGYPATPLVFLVLNAFTMVYCAWQKPEHALAGLVTLVVGIALYFPAKGRKIWG